MILVLVMVKERGEGKTTALIDWLLRGNPIEGKPGWSRLVIVLRGEREAVRLRQRVHKYATEQGYIRPGAADRHDIHNRLQQAVVVLGRPGELRGFDSRRYEIAIDDAQFLINETLARSGILKEPAAITINGEAWV
jgi:hypothetical protein